MLGLRIKLDNADWSRYERGSEAFFDVDTDLEKLSRSNPQAAEQLWKTTAPPGTKYPHYLESALVRAQKEHVAMRESPAAGEPEKEAFKLPGSIVKRFIQTEGKFHFRDAQNQLAFQDLGKKMQTEHNNPDIAASMVELAKAKGWTQLKVRGHEDFKREVWLQASLRGIEVTGYKPRDIDLAKLDELRAAKGINSVERAAGREPRPFARREPTKSEGHEQQHTNAGGEREKSSDEGNGKASSLAGRLVAHGEAHVDFDPQNEKSYFMKVETPNGTRIQWGQDLRQVLDASGARTGDEINLERAVAKDKSEPAWSVSLTATKQPELKPEQKVVIGVLSEVLREKRYSEKTIASAVEEATQRLQTIERNGQAAPDVKIYDRKAPRIVERPKVVSKTRERDLQRTR